MTLPLEYQNLIRSKALEVVQATPGAVPAFLQQAENYLASAKQIDPRLSMQVFTNAYEGYFQLVDAFLEHHRVRTKDAGRNLVIQRVSADLKLGTDEMRVIIRAHARRNGTSYHSPFPPISRAEAMALLAILEKYIPVAYGMLGVQRPQSGTLPDIPSGT
jgi:hypothetical protein